MARWRKKREVSGQMGEKRVRKLGAGIGAGGLRKQAIEAMAELRGSQLIQMVFIRKLGGVLES